MTGITFQCITMCADDSANITNKHYVSWATRGQK